MNSPGIKQRKRERVLNPRLEPCSFSGCSEGQIPKILLSAYKPGSQVLESPARPRALQHQSVAVNTKHREPPAPAAFTFKPWQAPASQHIPVEFQPSAESCSSPAEPTPQMSAEGRQDHHSGNLCSCSQQHQEMFAIHSKFSLKPGIFRGTGLLAALC